MTNRQMFRIIRCLSEIQHKSNPLLDLSKRQMIVINQGSIVTVIFTNTSETKYKNRMGAPFLKSSPGKYYAERLSPGGYGLGVAQKFKGTIDQILHEFQESDILETATISDYDGRRDL